MTTTTRALAIAAVALAGITTVSYWFLNIRAPIQVTVTFASPKGESSTGFDYFQWSEALRENCPVVALIIHQEGADYSLKPEWGTNGWSVLLLRSDTAVILDADNPDYKKLLRMVCRAITRDAPLWIATQARAATRRTANSGENNEENRLDQNRYELREVRNGALSTTALLDTRRGRVWIWTKLTDKNGAATGRSGFFEEEVSPDPKLPE
jgi:hypothetical protein